MPDAPFVGHSDSELLGHWYKKEGKITNEMIDEQDGIFAFMLMDHKTGHFTVARDAMGICPLYWGKGADGSMWFASEMKAIQDVCAEFEIFPPVRRHFIPFVLCARPTHAVRTLSSADIEIDLAAPFLKPCKLSLNSCVGTSDPDRDTVSRR